MDQQINQLTPQQRQAVLMRAQQEANQQIMQDMVQRMVKTCFSKCAGTSVSHTCKLIRSQAASR
jgi:DNA-directed RNA polymerase specialized sigma24 family protein